MAGWKNIVYVLTEEECINCGHQLDEASDGTDEWLECQHCGYWTPIEEED